MATRPYSDGTVLEIRLTDRKSDEYDVIVKLDSGDTLAMIADTQGARAVRVGDPVMVVCHRQSKRGTATEGGK